MLLDSPVRRRRRRPRIGRWLLVLAILAAIAGGVYAWRSQAEAGDARQEAAQRFATAWWRGDHAAMTDVTSDMNTTFPTSQTTGCRADCYPSRECPPAQRSPSSAVDRTPRTGLDDPSRFPKRDGVARRVRRGKLDEGLQVERRF